MYTAEYNQTLWSGYLAVQLIYFADIVTVYFIGVLKLPHTRILTDTYVMRV